MTSVVPVRGDGTSPLDTFPHRSILITGADGMLGSAFAGLLRREQPSLSLHAYGRRELDVTDRAAVGLTAKLEPELIIHCAALVNMDLCERDPQLCRRVIVDGTAHVAELAARTGARVIYPQSMLVFGMTAEVPFPESVEPVPGSEYGRAKLDAERLILAECSEALVVRMGGFFGGEIRDKNFVGTFSRGLLSRLAAGVTQVEVGDRVWQPSFTEDLAANTLLLAARRRTGIYHMAAHGEATFFEVAEEVVKGLGLVGQVQLVQRPAAEFGSREAAPRPLRAVLDNARLRAEGLDRQRPWRDALAEYLARPYFREMASHGRPPEYPRAR